MLFAVAESPRVHSINFDCLYTSDSTTIRAYPSEERSLSISGSELSGPKAAVDRALQFLFPDINFDAPAGKIEFNNKWQECPNSNLAYWTYELTAGFDPVIGAHAKFPLGAGAMIPRWISRRVSAGFYLKLEGKLTWVGMLERNEYGVTSGRAPLTGEVGGEVGYELMAGGARGFVGMTIAGGTSFTGGGDVLVDQTARKIILKDAKVNWDGVVLRVNIDMWWGRVERSRSWEIIAPPATPVWGPTDLSFPP